MCVLEIERWKAREGGKREGEGHGGEVITKSSTLSTTHSLKTALYTASVLYDPSRFRKNAPAPRRSCVAGPRFIKSSAAAIYGIGRFKAKVTYESMIKSMYDRCVGRRSIGPASSRRCASARTRSTPM